MGLHHTIQSQILSYSVWLCMEPEYYTIDKTDLPFLSQHYLLTLYLKCTSLNPVLRMRLWGDTVLIRGKLYPSNHCDAKSPHNLHCIFLHLLNLLHLLLELYGFSYPSCLKKPFTSNSKQISPQTRIPMSFEVLGRGTKPPHNLHQTMFGSSLPYRRCLKTA